MNGVTATELVALGVDGLLARWPFAETWLHEQGLAPGELAEELPQRASDEEEGVALVQPESRVAEADEAQQTGEDEEAQEQGRGRLAGLVLHGAPPSLRARATTLSPAGRLPRRNQRASK